ncbi:MAG: phosphatase PAP2 family protein [Maritimibacter sp.]|nr:phosphatase PAP2 family protein [Maritimibacter sp.]
MARGILTTIRHLAAAAALTVGLLPSVARAQDSLASFTWPDHPFARTLPDALFVDTGEARFQKAGRALAQSWGGIGAELGQIATFPLSDPATFGAFALGVGALTLVDKPTTVLYQKTFLPVGEKFNLPRLVQVRGLTIDAQYLALGVAGTYAYGLAANDERAQVAALLATKAVAYSYLTSHLILKTAFGRVRPVQDLDGHTGPTGDYTTSPFEFFRSTGVHFDTHPYATGMPSFHFTMYFSTARVYSGVYDNYVIPYGIAAALALQSAEGHNHWVSDMVAGALIGTGIGNVILSNYEDRRGVSAMVTPIASSKGVGLGLQMSF